MEELNDPFLASRPAWFFPGEEAPPVKKMTTVVFPWKSCDQKTSERTAEILRMTRAADGVHRVFSVNGGRAREDLINRKGPLVPFQDVTQCRKSTVSNRKHADDAPQEQRRNPKENQERRNFLARRDA